MLPALVMPLGKVGKLPTRTFTLAGRICRKSYTATSLFHSNPASGETLGHSSGKKSDSFLNHILMSKANASTKWIVLVAHTTTVWSRLDFIAPFIVVGSILSVVLAEVMKKIINQARPKGAAPLDPGMPSSHALVTFFSAASWSFYLLNSGAIHSLSRSGCEAISFALILGSGCVSALRVVCGFHSIAQITVGAVVGVSAAYIWSTLGSAILGFFDTKIATAAAWVLYLIFSAVFIRERILRKWVGGRDVHS